MTIDINTEIGEDNKLLDDIDNNIDRTNNKVKKTIY